MEHSHLTIIFVVFQFCLLYYDVSENERDGKKNKLIFREKVNRQKTPHAFTREICIFLIFLLYSLLKRGIVNKRSRTVVVDFFNNYNEIKKYTAIIYQIYRKIGK